MNTHTHTHTHTHTNKKGTYAAIKTINNENNLQASDAYGVVPALITLCNCQYGSHINSINNKAIDSLI